MNVNCTVHAIMIYLLTYLLTYLHTGIRRTMAEFHAKYYTRLFANQLKVFDHLLRGGCIQNKQIRTLRGSFDIDGVPEDFPRYTDNDKEVIASTTKR